MKKTITSLLASLLLVGTLSGCTAKTSYTLSEEGKQRVAYSETLLEKQSAMNEEIISQLQGGTLAEPKILVNPYGISPLSALMQFDTESATAVTMVVKGTKPETDLTFTFESAAEHILPVVGLLAGQETTVVLTLDDGSVYEYQIMGGALPEGAFHAEVTQSALDVEANMLYFTTPSSTGYATGYDSEGEIRWILNIMMLWDLNLLDNGKITLSTDRILNSPYYTTGFVTMDLLGHIEADYSLPGGYHHDIDQLPNGNYLVASDDFSTDTVEDVAVEVDATSGEVVKSFHLRDILPMNEGKSLNWTKEDWFHNNSVDYNEATNTLTLSGRHQDAVVVLDYETQELKYIIGSPDGWSEEMQKYFLTPIGDDFEWQWAQHAATWLSDTQLMLFDNGMYRSKDEDTALSAEENYSRMVIYEIDEEAMTIRQVMEYGKERGYEYYSPYISDADQLDEDRYLITSGGISWLDGKINNMPGSLTEFDQMDAYVTEIKDGEVIFELKIPANVYRAEKIDVSKVTMTELTAGKHLGNLGETAYDTAKSRELTLDVANAEPLSDELKSAVVMSQESDRLMVTATLHKDDDFDVVLVREDEERIYAIQTDSQPGVCVAVFNDAQKQPEYSTMIQTISSHGLSGKWHVYYLQNDVLIDAMQIVEFE